MQTKLQNLIIRYVADEGGGDGLTSKRGIFDGVRLHFSKISKSA